MTIRYEVQGSRLVFLADNAGRKELGEVSDYPSRFGIVLDHVAGTALDQIQPEEIGALTSSPIFALDAQRDDHGNLTDAGTVYWFPDYAIKDEWDELRRYGRVAFPAAPTYQPSNLNDMRDKLREEIANTGDT